MWDVTFLLDPLQDFILHTIGSTGLFHPCPAPHFKTFPVFLAYLPKCRRVNTILSSAPIVALNSFFLKFTSNLLVKRLSFLLNAVYAVAILDLISSMHLASFIIMLPK
jgi:hypothetical protein